MSATIRDVNKIPGIIAELRRMRALAVEAGLFADIVPKKTMIAAHANEFGAWIKKTPRMQAWLGAMARRYNVTLDPAKGNPKYIVIPARSFVRSAAHQHQDAILGTAERMVEGVVTGQLTAVKSLHAIGIKMEQAIKTQINLVNAPRLHPLTIAMKGGDKPLVASGGMRNAVTYRIRARGAT